MIKNLAADNPQKLAELQALFTKEAIEHKVLPIDDRTIERFDPKVAGRPDLMDGRTKLTVYPGMVYMSENAFINVKNTSVDLVADLEVKGDKNHGVLLAQGGRFGGWALWVDHGKPIYTYNFLGLEVFRVSGNQAMSDGKHTIKMAFDYDKTTAAGGRGAGGKATLYLDGKMIGEGTISKTHANTFSLDDTADTGIDTGTPVDEGYGEGRKNGFNGVLKKVSIELR
jgi:arylsulfatase